MEEFGAVGVVFVITDYIGRNNDWDIHFGLNRSAHVNRDQIIALHQAGWEIASHGCNHQSFTQLTVSEIRRQLQTSKAVLEEITGSPVLSLTAPFNAMVPCILELAAEAGYHTVYGQMKPGFHFVSRQNVRYIPRRMVYSIDGPGSVLRKTSGHLGLELIKENIIHFCANATTGVKELL